MTDVSIVVPCYKSGNWLEELVSRISAAMIKLNRTWELILVDDASPDDGNTYSVIRKIAHSNSNIVGIRLQFNVGQFKALLAAIDQSSGDIIVTMDDDLQHPPEELPKLIEALEDDPKIDCIIGKYESKSHGIIRNLGSKLVGFLLRRLSGRPKGLKTTSFRAFKRPVGEAILAHRTVRPVMGSLVLMSTNRIKNVTVEHHARPHGNSGWGFGKMVLATKDLVFNSTTWPLRSFIYMGMITAISAFLAGGFMLVSYLYGSITVPGYTSLILTMLFLGGIQLAGLGMMGEYIDRILSEVQSPPRWVIAESSHQNATLEERTT